ncbi:MAG: OB-fold domain-containing protein [Candidatus Helarchaeota archaeon]
MVGIRSYGAYLPAYKLDRKAIAKAWDFPKAPGTKSIANQDEDSVTMGVAAAIHCLGDIDPKEIDGLFFASTTPPYTEKQNASTIAAVLDLRKDIVTADFTNTTKAGTTALRSAYDAISSGKAKNILIVVADKREPQPVSMYEYQMADGAAALLISDQDGIAKIEGYYSVNNELVGPWRKEGQQYVHSFEIKVETKYGYMENIIAAIKGLMEKYELSPDSVAKAAYYSPDPRSHGRVAKALKIPTKAMVDSNFMEMGNTGTPLCFHILISAFEKAPPNGNIILAGYGDGADAFYLIATEKAKEMKKEKGKFQKLIKKQILVDNYNKYLENRLLVKSRNFFVRKSSPVTMWRDIPSIYPLYGFKCNKCGLIQYPIMIGNCISCMSDDITPHKMGRKGKIFTFSLDHLVGGEYKQTPVPRCVVDVEGGGRMLLDMTDCYPRDTYVGQEVELTFRKYSEGAEFDNYYWKCRPIERKKKKEEAN